MAGTDDVVNKTKATEERVKGTVARGRTVITTDGIYTAGMEVTESRGEIARLRRLGYLMTPGHLLLPLGNGPRFFQEDKAAAGAKEP